jgi:glycosyltransferase involved in cell wall biosynthesis
MSPDQETLVLIFSKDRPLQLDATLRSFMIHCLDFDRQSVRILVRASNERYGEAYHSLEKEYSSYSNIALIAETEFRQQVVHLLRHASYVLWLVDDNLFVRDFSLHFCREMLAKEPDALGYSLRLGKNTTYCYSLDLPQPPPEFTELPGAACLFDWTCAAHDFGYPLEISSSLYRTGELLPLLEALFFRNPNSLEAEMAGRTSCFTATFPKLLCSELSVAFCNPINKVQNISGQNRSGDTPELATESLLESYLKGKRVDVAAYAGFIPNACHQEVTLHLRESPDSAPLVSVVIPCYSQAHFLAEAVESVVAQTYRNWECIIVNDGSPDNTSEVARGLIDRHPGRAIRLLEKPNGGLADARNFGMGRAGGTYLLPLDSDDILHPEMLAKTVAYLDSHPGLAIVYTDLVHFGTAQKHVITMEYDFQALKYANLLNYCSLYRREVWEGVGGYNTNMTWGYEDWDFWIGAGERGFWAGRLPEALLFYRVKSESMFTKALEHDAELKAQVVTNHPWLYSEQERLWAREQLLEAAASRVAGTADRAAGHANLPQRNDPEAPAQEEIPGRAGDGARTSRRKVVVVCHYYHDSGGTEVLARNLADGLEVLGCDTDLLYLSIVPLELPVKQGEIKFAGSVHYLAHSDYHELASAIRKLAPDTVLLVTDIFGDTLDCFAELDFGTAFHKIVYLNINNQAHDYLSHHGAAAEQRCRVLRKYDVVITMFEESLATRFLRRSGLPCRIIGIGIPQIQAGPSSFKLRYNIPHGSHLLIYPALVAPLKNQIALIELADQLEANVTIVFMGDLYLPASGYIDEFRSKLSLANNCIHLPGLSRTDVAQAMLEASLCLFPSLSEGAPLTLVEAMSHGLPWITTPEVVFAGQLEGGVIAELAQFPAQIKRLLEKPAQLEQLGKEGKACFESRFKIEHTVDAFRRLINELPAPPGKLPVTVIDGVFFQMNNTGIARLWKALLAEWAGTEFGSSIVVLDRIGTAPRFPGIRYRVVPAYDYMPPDWDRTMLQQVCAEEKAEMFLSTYYTTPISTPSVFLAYDMIPEFTDCYDLSEPQWQEKHRAIRQASAFIAISRSTALDLGRLYPEFAERVVVAHCGVDREFFCPAPPGEIRRFRERHGIRNPYFMFVGGRNGYKNGRLLFEAFGRLPGKERYALLCSGGQPALEAQLQALAGNAEVRVAGLTDQELRTAYSGALALVYPSKYEGFGLPILEAMGCGCPVITCQNSSLPEVAGAAALYVEPDDPEQLASAMLQVQIPEVRRQLITMASRQASRFSWNKMAGTIQDVICSRRD